MAYVSTNNGLFKVIKRSIYEHMEGRIQEAKDLGQEFTRQVITDGDIQVTIDVLQQRRAGKEAFVPTIMGKIGYGKAQFLNAFLNNLNIKEFIKTPITLRQVDQSEFLKDVSALMKVSPERRQALLDVIRTVLPKIEGLGMKTAFAGALTSGDASTFFDFKDVSDEQEVE